MSMSELYRYWLLIFMKCMENNYLAVVLISSRYNKAEWETNPDYCDGVKERSPFNEGRSLLDLVDLHIFDFIQGKK